MHALGLHTNCSPFSQVNADIKKYKLENGVPRLFEVDKTTVGKYLSTKAVGSYQREDLTSSVSCSTINIQHSRDCYLDIVQMCN